MTHVISAIFFAILFGPLIAALGWGSFGKVMAALVWILAFLLWCQYLVEKATAHDDHT